MGGEGSGALPASPAAQRAQRLQSVLTAVVETDPRGILVRDGDGRPVEINQSARRLLGLGPREDPVEGPSIPGGVVDGRGRPVAPHDLPDEVARRTGEVVAEQVLGVEGGTRWLAVSAVPVAAPDGRWVVTQLRDVTAETIAVVDLQRQARVDPLTGVGNRRLLDWTVDDLIDPDEHVGIVLLDVDRFKDVNDRYGHDVGDQVLRQIGERVEAACRPDDVAVRLGGDEFVIVLRRLEDRADACEIVGRIALVLQPPFVTDAGLLEVSCSLGWTTGSAVAAKQLVREADRRMYESKHAATIDLRRD